MGRELFQQNKQKLYALAGALVLLLAVCFCVDGVLRLMTSNNGKQVSNILQKITYTEDGAEAEMAQLEEQTRVMLLSDSAKGSLYKALAELSYMTGDDMLYNKYIATALYYLEKSQDVESVVYLTNKYMGRLYANGCYEAAEELLVELNEKHQISSFSLDIQASYYLSRADVAQMLGNSAEGFLAQAEAAILLMPEDGDKLLNKAKADLLTAREHMVNDQWDEAEAILSQYSETDDFGFGENQVYVICDFQIPYYELMTKQHLHEEQVRQAQDELAKYCSLCEQFQFRAMELHLLQYVNRQPEMKSSQKADTYEELEKSIMQKNLSEITNEYAQILLTDMDNTKEALRQNRIEKEHQRNYIRIGIVCLILLMIGSVLISILLDYMNCDGLTKLNNRKKFEIIRNECDRKKIPYGFLMLDIDDFKKVNDTLGHQQGDVVLSGIARILLDYTGRGIYAFRYGGEELCMMFLHVPEKRCREIAEEIRSRVAQTQFSESRKITVSGGLCMSENGENVFLTADKKLYEAKLGGKNRIC